MDDTIIITRESRCLSIMNIHGARCAGCRRRKACMGWSGAAACGVQGRGILRDFPHSLLIKKSCFYTAEITTKCIQEENNSVYLRL